MPSPTNLLLDVSKLCCKLLVGRAHGLDLAAGVQHAAVVAVADRLADFMNELSGVLALN
jgi:hypothetical protein